MEPEHRPVKDQKEKSREKNGRASLRSLKTPKLNPDTCSKSWTRYGIVPTAKRLGMTRGKRSDRADSRRGPRLYEEEKEIRRRAKPEEFSRHTIII